MVVLFGGRLVGSEFEDVHRVKSVKQYLPKDKSVGRKSALVQFYAADGGLRTVRARDIVKIRK